MCDACQTWEQTFWGIVILIIIQAGFRVCYILSRYNSSCIRRVFVFLNIFSRRQFHTRGWHGDGVCSAFKAQLASHKSCNVSTQVYYRGSIRVGVNYLYIDFGWKMYTEAFIPKSFSRSPACFCFMLQTNWPHPWCSVRLSHRVTNRHTHTNYNSKSLRSHLNCCIKSWPLSAAVKFFLNIFCPWNFGKKRWLQKLLCLLSLVLWPSLPNQLNQPNNQWIYQSVATRSDFLQSKQKEIPLGWLPGVTSTGLLVTLIE